MKSSELHRKLLKDGWYKIAQTGSHIKMVHPTRKALTRSGYLEFPLHGSAEVGKELAALLLKQTGLK